MSINYEFNSTDCRESLAGVYTERFHAQSRAVHYASAKAKQTNRQIITVTSFRHLPIVLQSQNGSSNSSQGIEGEGRETPINGGDSTAHIHTVAFHFWPHWLARQRRSRAAAHQTKKASNGDYSLFIKQAGPDCTRLRPHKLHFPKVVHEGFSFVSRSYSPSVSFFFFTFQVRRSCFCFILSVLQAREGDGVCSAFCLYSQAKAPRIDSNFGWI